MKTKQTINVSAEIYEKRNYQENIKGIQVIKINYKGNK